MARLFVAVWPPASVVQQLADLPRSEQAGVRWTTAEQWHVTLRFFGEASPEAATAALGELADQPLACEAVIGGRARRLGASAFVLPVAGLEELAAAVERATRDIGQPPPERRFHGHLTLARCKGPATPVLASEVTARWLVTSVALVESRTLPDGARYETLVEVPLAPAVRSQT